MHSYCGPCEREWSIDFGDDNLDISLQSKSVAVYELDNNEAAFSVAVVPFSARSGELLLVVGTASNTQLTPRSCSSGYLRVYAFMEGGSALELLHKVLFVLLMSTGRTDALYRPKRMMFLRP